MLLEINNSEVDVEIVKIGSPVCSALDFDKYKRWSDGKQMAGWKA